MTTTIGVTINDEIPTKKELSEEEKQQIKFYLGETKNLIAQMKAKKQEKARDLEPALADHWEFELGGLSPQVVSRVQFPNYRKVPGAAITDIAASRRKLTVTFRESLNSSTFQAIEQMILTGELYKPVGTLKFLNGNGEVAKTYVFIGMEIESVDFDPLDHQCKHTLKAQVAFSYQIMKELEVTV
jgi:hypothetical protein